MSIENLNKAIEHLSMAGMLLERQRHLLGKAGPYKDIHSDLESRVHEAAVMVQDHRNNYNLPTDERAIVIDMLVAGKLEEAIQALREMVEPDTYVLQEKRGTDVIITGDRVKVELRPATAMGNFITFAVQLGWKVTDTRHRDADIIHDCATGLIFAFREMVRLNTENLVTCNHQGPNGRNCFLRKDHDGEHEALLNGELVRWS